MTASAYDEQPPADYRDAVVDLLGVLAYGELTAFERMTDDARLAPSLDDRIALIRMAALEFAHLERLCERLRELDADPSRAMEPFVDAFEDFHGHTAPADWHEGLVKAYVGDGLAADFYLEIAQFLDEPDRALVEESLQGAGHAEFVVEHVRAAIAADPRLAGRLALWGRRLMGEALVQAQRVAADHDGLTALLAGTVGRPGMDLTLVGEMLARLSARHADRMTALGLDA